MIRVLFFGELKDITECSEWSCNMATDTNELKELVIKRWPKLKNKTFVLAINKLIEHNTVAINSDDVVAFLPPFSGG